MFNMIIAILTKGKLLDGIVSRNGIITQPIIHNQEFDFKIPYCGYLQLAVLVLKMRFISYNVSKTKNRPYKEALIYKGFACKR